MTQRVHCIRNEEERIKMGDFHVQKMNLENFILADGDHIPDVEGLPLKGGGVSFGSSFCRTV